ncbi:hypothetical protein [Streptomyces collinus]|uniref:hypothetical protein n=1 Tax=Streptomyces collinus TaxID=42684 RepID=UPI0036CE59EE
MRILLGAQSCGYGPISKLVAVSRMLHGHWRTFSGETVAADFARRNSEAFDEIVDGAASARTDLVRSSDYIISVMDADLVFQAYSAGRPAMMIDSLLSFWQLRRPPAAISELCGDAPRGDHRALMRHFADLSPHERIFAAHLLADVSLVQNFPGVPERAQDIAGFSTGQVYVTGPITDRTGLHDANARTGSGFDLLINLGGFKNFLLDYDRHNTYLMLFDRWVPDLLRDWPAFRRVAVCSGGFGHGREHQVEVGGSVAEFTCMPQREFLREVATAQHYMLTPGLTAIHEAIQLEQMPLALPEQHYGHIVNVESLADTLFAKQATRFTQLIDGYCAPPDDFEGTAAIVRQVGRLLEDDGAYTRFRRGMNEAMEAFVATSATERADGVAELRDLLRGPSFHDIVSGIFASPSAQLIGRAQ